MGVGFDEFKSYINCLSMGLTICKKIVENHQGTIRANSKEGDGAVFTVLLPVRKNEILQA
jgi:signal transduction histidine kinase